MSREIGFRVWSKKYNTYFELSDIHYKDGKIDGIFAISGILAGIPNVIVLEPEDVVLEQDTGLKDKNGEKIYGGDIVLDYYDGEDAFIVEWDKDTASFILTGTDNIASVSFDNFYSDKDLEVIGNIHKNPELVGGEDGE